MCTVTWWSDPERYELFFSRDERMDRAEGLAPRLHSLQGTRYLCPRDPDGGGTWIFVNDHCLTLCLVNQYPEAVAPLKQPRISRGRLVESFANCDSIEQVTRKLFGTDLRHYEGFRMVALQPGSEGCLYTWDTHTMDVNDQARTFLPITSSSYMNADVVRARRKLFAELVVKGEDTSSDRLRAFHQRYMPEASSHSVFMQRDDSGTVSLCQVAVGPGRIEMNYQPKLKDEQRFGKAVTQILNPRPCAA